MAATVAAAAAAGAGAPHVKWSPSEYAFNPYELTAHKLPPAEDEEKLTGKAAGAGGVPIKRRPGRQKRTSVLCQVPGCGEELVSAKNYYRRYRICQSHCNMPSMMIEGRRQRFCQQCGRFHDIVEFESNKRSCKRKLKRHNERRRSSAAGAAKGKITWQSDSEEEEEEEEAEEEAYNVSSGSEAKVASSLKRRSSQRTAKRQAGTALLAQPHASADCSAASHNTGGGVVASPLASPLASLSEAPTSALQRAETVEPPGPAGSLPVHQLLPAGDLWQQKPGKARDLSMPSPAATLLAAPPSPQPSHALASAATGPSVMDADLESVLQQLLHDEELRGLQLDPLEMFLNTHESGEAPAPFKQEMIASQGSLHASADERPSSAWDPSQQQLACAAVDDLPMELLDDIPLVPLPAEFGGSSGAGPSAAASGRSGATLLHTPSASGGSYQPGGSLGPPLGGCSLPLPGAGDMPWQHQQWPGGPATMVPLAPAGPAGLASAMPSVLASAHGMLSAPGMVAAGAAPPLVCYNSRAEPSYQVLTCLSLKVFSCTPDRLLPAVRQELEDLLTAGQNLLEGYIRTGCTQLTVNALMPVGRLAGLQKRGLGAMVGDLLAGDGASDVLDQDMLVQFEGEMAVVKRRKVVALITLKNSPALVPCLGPLLPLAVAATADAPAATPLLLRCNHLAGYGDLVLARQQGQNLSVEMHGSGTARGGEWAKVRVLGLLPGCAEVEVQHATFISAPRPLLVLPSAAAVAEVRQLERSAVGVHSVDDMLRDMGLVVQWLERRALEAEGYPCPQYTPALLACVAGKARRLVAAAVARGWTAVTKMLLPATLADGSPVSEALAAANACCPSGTSLLHVAVGTGNVAMVEALGSWAAGAGGRLAVDARGTAGLTALHVAALLPNSAAMRAALAGLVPAAAKLWDLVQADDGTTPEALAEALAQSAAAAAVQCGEPSGAASWQSELTEVTSALKPSTSKPAGGLPAGEAGEAASTVSSSSGAVLLQRTSKKADAEGEAFPASCTTHRRRLGRQAMKQHLDDLHMTTILSEVESGVDLATRDPRPLADVLSGTVAAGVALFRALRPRAPQ